MTIVAFYFFAFQIYCDFSGYTDIARGIARLFNVELMENFRSPYLATSIRDFWKRWHISLSTWFRDYLYIPLGGNRVSALRIIFNILVVFSLCGLWHGASWNFMIWGFLHGILLSIQHLGTKFMPRIAAPSHWIILAIQRLLTFHLVTFLWIFFRAKKLEDSFIFIDKITSTTYINKLLGVIVMNYQNMLGVAFIFLLILIEINMFRFATNFFLNTPIGRYAASVVCLFLIFSFGFFDSAAFIYFQF